jgi:hypothetical protein
MDPTGGDAGRPRLICPGFSGDGLPPELHDPQLGRLDESGGWRLTCREGIFDFRARGFEVHQAMPGFFDGMLAGYALRSRDRAVVRWLLRLLRLPGGARLLRAWHAGRGR